MTTAAKAPPASLALGMMEPRQTSKPVNSRKPPTKINRPRIIRLHTSSSSNPGGARESANPPPMIAGIEKTTT